VEFQYNNKKHAATGYTLFELWMTFMERESYCKDKITKTGEFSSRTTRKLESSKEVDKDSKRNYEEAI